MMSKNLKRAIFGLFCFFLSGGLTIACLLLNAHLGVIAFGLSFGFSEWYSFKKLDAWGNEKLVIQKT